MKKELFEDQEEFVDNLRHALSQGHKSILGVASPAFGKTVVAGHIIAQARKKSDASAWFLVHRKNLLRQTSKSFWGDHIEHGLLTSGKMRSNLPIQVGTIGTVYSRLDALKPPTLLFIDEAHLSGGNMFSTVIDRCRAAGSIVIGLTGTPERLDGKPLSKYFDTLVEARPTSWLIEQGRLSDYVMYSSAQLPDLSGVETAAGDYNRSHLASAMGKPVLTGDAIAHWRKHANGMRTVVYCCNVKHSRDTAQAFNDAGIPAVHVDADTTEAELKDACEGLADRRYLVLCNCDLLIEGFDLSAQVDRDVTLECCILLRPTQSLARYLQMVFRALRRKPQAAVLLDHAGCAMRHGLPDDQRQWVLSGRKKSKRNASEEADIRIQTCPSCRHTFRPGVPACPMCGAVVVLKPRIIQQVDGELQKIERSERAKAARIEQGQARTLRELIRVGIQRKLQHPAHWAANIFASRGGRKATAQDFQEARAIHRTIITEAQR